MKMTSCILRIVLVCVFSMFSLNFFAVGNIPSVAAPRTDHQGGIRYEKNKGQWPDQVAFKADVPGGRRIFFERNKFTCVVYDHAAVDHLHGDAASGPVDNTDPLINFHAFSMNFVGSSLQVITGLSEQSYHLNYFIGNDPSRWATDVPVYGSVKYEQLYPGIDLLLHAGKSRFKYDYIVAPGADPSRIVVEIEGAENISIVDGKLVIRTSVGEITESIPYCYQVINNKEVAVKCVYKLQAGGKRVSFSFPEGFHRDKLLVIDPVLIASTYSGSTFNTYGHCATYDAAGNIYTGGRCFGAGYPTTTGAYQLNYSGQVDIAISKLNPTGTNLLYATYLGGTLSDYPHSMFVDASNELYVYGSSTSSNYPVTSNAMDGTANGNSDMIISKLSMNGNSLLGSTYLGGSAADGINTGIAPIYGDNYRGEIIVDQAGNVFIAACSSSSNFPVTNGAYDVTQNGMQDAVLVKLNGALSSMIWATYIGSAMHDVGCSLRIASNGEIFMVGSTMGQFPTTAGALNATNPGGSSDGFVVKFSSSGSNLLASTLIGTTVADQTYLMDLDYNDDVYIYGSSSGSMPIINAAFSVPNSQNYVSKLNNSLSSYIFSTTFGNGTHNTFSPCAFMVDYCQNLYMCGWGGNLNYPVSANATQSTTTGNSFYLLALSNNAGSMIYGSFFGAGGEHVDGGTSRFDKSGKVYQGVCCCGNNFPTMQGGWSPNKLSNSCDIVVFKVDFEVNCNALAVNTVICYGGSATFTIPNVNGLSNPTFVLQPGNLTNNNGVYSFTPQSTVSYSATLTGYTPANSIASGTGIVSILVQPVPVLTPTVVQPTCLTNTASFNLGLSFLPANSSSAYNVLWAPVPSGVTSGTQLAASGTMVPGPYSATLTAAGGCKAFTTFTINPVPDPSVFNIAGPFVVTCADPVRTVSATPATYNYTWTGTTGSYNGPAASFSAANTGTWLVVGQNNVSGCTSAQVFTITQNITVTTVSVTPAFQNINCIANSANNVTATSTPSTNVTHMWLAPSGGSYIASAPQSVYNPGSPGTFTCLAIDNSNGCLGSATFTLSTTSAFPTFSVVSPQNFTIGCSTKSVSTINIVGAQTSPPGGSVSYTLLPPGFAGNYTVGPGSSYTNVVQPGTYTVIVKDLTNGCETRVPVSVMQNTLVPHLRADYERDVLTCDLPAVVLKAFSNTPDVSYNWSFAGVPGNVTSDSLRVKITTNKTASLTGNYTLQVTDNNNSCVSATIVTILQNIMPPNAFFSGAAPITCKTPTLVLTNISTTKVLPYFTPFLAVVAYQWDGPTPMEPVQFQTTYLAAYPGVYTLTAKDLNNGCLATYTAFVEDGRDFPALRRPLPQFTLDCGANAVPIYPAIDGPLNNLSYQWTAVQEVTMSAMNTATTLVNKSGHYEIVITNTLNGCVSSGLVEVEDGTLVAGFYAEPEKGYAPFTTTFNNFSTSSSTLTGRQSTSIWSFANGKQATLQGTVNPQMTYTQPGKYKIRLFVSKGTCSDSTSRDIEVLLPSRLKVPNIFSPNGDKINDLFFFEASALAYINFKVVDRWGNLVYALESTTGNVEWNGMTQSGKQAADGVYIYVLSATGEDGVEFEQSGTITLVR